MALAGKCVVSALASQPSNSLLKCCSSGTRPWDNEHVKRLLAYCHHYTNCQHDEPFSPMASFASPLALIPNKAHIVTYAIMWSSHNSELRMLKLAKRKNGHLVSCDEDSWFQVNIVSLLLWTPYTSLDDTDRLYRAQETLRGPKGVLFGSS